MLIVFGMYKYVSSEAGMQNLISKSSHSIIYHLNNQQLLERENKKFQNAKRHQLYCNSIENLVPAEEGGAIEGWSLQGKKS